MKNYKMLVEIPINDVPDSVSYQEARVTSEIWLKQKIDDAVLLEFEEETVRMEGNDNTTISP